MGVSVDNCHIGQQAEGGRMTPDVTGAIRFITCKELKKKKRERDRESVPILEKLQCLPAVSRFFSLLPWTHTDDPSVSF